MESHIESVLTGSVDTGITQRIEKLVNIAVWLERNAKLHADEPAIGLGHRVVASYRELAAAVAGLAHALHEEGRLRPGDRVALIAKNDAAYLEALFAVWWAGLVAVPINAKLHPSEIDWILDHAGVRAAFVSADLEGDVGHGSATEPRVVSLSGAAYQRWRSSAPVPLVPRDGIDPAWLFYTSGTTGRPKGAVLTHSNLIAMSMSHLIDVDPTKRGDAFIHAAPLSHGSGMLALPHLLAGGVNVIPESGAFHPEEVLALAGSWPGASTFLAPTMVRRLVDCPEDTPAGFRTIIWGGAPMLVADVVRAVDRFGPHLAQIYGQGESPMTITALRRNEIGDQSHPDWRARLATAGTQRSVVDVRIATADGRSAAIDELGEVLVRGGTVMLGYWDNADATRSAIQGGWLHTGDLGCLNQDGYLTLLDRKKDLVISGGSNIYPREVEEVIAAHPGVEEVSVIGRPDPEWGEVVVAYVVGTAEPAELDRHCVDRIARFKRPRDYVLLDELPKNNYGKVLKTELRAMDAMNADVRPADARQR
ncbi:AMP-binding protein [Dactylosporangium sp. AC04546]|uniref:AMP-binding protein n=1 Tax=Dactylosporangium sp. AC04546 TaxID=2862460 RepID=UPI001EDF4747|nr:AMP-binding protein [Dactylosporangium sp. AC04546]WVK86589.1 AMP-binding protein [Dactylosporangium sp. AC04546]